VPHGGEELAYDDPARRRLASSNPPDRGDDLVEAEPARDVLLGA
jgi:hypothetical protein